MRTIIPAVAIFSVAAQPVLACSVSPSYRVPTNLELAADADLVMLGKVEAGATRIEGPDMEMTVTPIAALKGELPPKPIKLPGMIAEKRFAVLSNPRELEQAHPLAYIGGCTRYMFIKGATVLFFLKPAEKAFDGAVPAELKGRWMPADDAFSRWAEDVPGENSPWVRASRIYIAATALPKEKQRQMMVVERDKLRAAGDSESKLIADDIDRQLAGPNKPWNQLMEEEIEKMKKRGEDPLEDLAKDL